MSNLGMAIGTAAGSIVTGKQDATRPIWQSINANEKTT